MIKVSVVVPVCNVEKFLVECLDSIIKQTLKEIEIICVNDGSTDNSLKILEQYAEKDARIQVVDKLNAGYGHTMNMGFSKAKGEYIGIVESDDFIASNMFEVLYKLAKENDADVVKSNYIAYRASSEVKYEKVEPLWRCPYNQVFNSQEVPEVFTVQPCIWSAIYKSDLIKKFDIKFNETPGASFQDTAFAFKVWTYAQRVFFTKDAFLFYRSDNLNSSVQSLEKVYCICEEFDEIERHVQKLSERRNDLMPLIQWLKLREYKWNYGRLGKQFRYEFLLHMKEEFEKAREQGFITDKWLNIDEINEINSIIDNTEEYFNFVNNSEAEIC